MLTNLPALHALAAAIAPELSAAPLYIVPLPPAASVHGFCESRLEPAFRERLRAAGEWRGPGALIGIAADEDEESTIGILLHELAHALPFTPPAAADYSPADVQHAGRLLSSFLALPPADWPPKRCFWHNDQFVRNCVHLQYRAARRGVEVPFPAIIPTGQNAVPPVSMLARALGDEPERMIDASFAEIAAEPFPAAFTHIWSR